MKFSNRFFRWVVPVTLAVLLAPVFTSHLALISANDAPAAQDQGLDYAENYNLTISPSEARQTANLYLQGTDPARINPNVADSARDGLFKLLQSYRLGGASAAVQISSIENAPYITMLMKGPVEGLYLSTYDAEYAKAYEANVAHVSLEAIYDGFMDAIIDGSLPLEMKKTGDQIGPCLARKILSGKSGACPLDPSETPAARQPSKFDLLLAKLSCGSKLIFSPCQTRKLVYDAAKAELVSARKSGVVTQIFNRRFPVEYREGFIKQITSIRKGLVDLILAKMGGDKSPFWSASTPLLQAESIPSAGPGPFAPLAMTLHDFALELQADIRAAAFLQSDKRGAFRGAASALLYSAANHLLVLMGGNEAVWNGENFVLESAPPATAPAHPLEKPKPLPFALKSAPFGGLGVQLDKKGDAVFGPWDLAAYDPGDANPALRTPARLFPARFMAGRRGAFSLGKRTDAAEDLSDLADLIEGALAFAQATSPKGVFGPNFVSSDALQGVLDPKNPAIFPTEGRALAFGVIGAILQNLAMPLGHVAQLPDGAKISDDYAGAFNTAFYDRIGLTGPLAEKTSIRGMARVLVAIAALREYLDSGDPAIPAPLLGSKVSLDTALQVGALTVGGKAQTSDGGVYEQLGTPIANGRTLETALDTMRAFNAAYQGSGRLALRFSARQLFFFMERFWGTGAIPRMVENSTGLLVPPSLLWKLVDTWQEVRGSNLYKDLQAQDADWVREKLGDRWDERVKALRLRLLGQFSLPDGPHAIPELAP